MFCQPSFLQRENRDETRLTLQFVILPCQKIPDLYGITRVTIKPIVLVLSYFVLCLGIFDELLDGENRDLRGQNAPLFLHIVIQRLQVLAIYPYDVMALRYLILIIEVFLQLGYFSRFHIKNMVIHRIV